MRALIKKIIHQVFNALFPAVCYACGNTLYEDEKDVCNVCMHEMPKTHFWPKQENKAAELFYGLIRFEYIAAHYYFNKETRIQNLMHKLKYRNRPEIGFKLGREIGKTIQEHTPNQIDFIIPVPLHQKKFKKRGYNQSDYIADGISSTSQIPTVKALLLRSIETSTQTKKSKMERRENMKNVFELNPYEAYKNAHFLLTDDVLTTGATLESAAAKLLEIPGAKVSVYTLAIATNQ